MIKELALFDEEAQDIDPQQLLRNLPLEYKSYSALLDDILRTFREVIHQCFLHVQESHIGIEFHFNQNVKACFEPENEEPMLISGIGVIINQQEETPLIIPFYPKLEA